MKALLTTAALLAAFVTGSAWAADPDPHAGRHPAPLRADVSQPAAAPSPGAGAMGAGMGPTEMHSMQGMDEKAMHEMCNTVMAKEMKNRPVHEHSREKGGVAMWPNGKPLTKEEMADMHRRCAAMMGSEAEQKAK